MTMMMMVLIALFSAAGGALAVYLCSASSRKKAMMQMLEKDSRIRELETRLEMEGQAHARIQEETRRMNDSALEEVRRAHAETLGRQMEAMKTAFKAESDEVLRKREEELSRKAQETFTAISGNLGKDIRSMKDAFEKNRSEQTASSSSMKENINAAIKNLEENTKAIGNKADHLADALRGQNKMQGCWGETILQTLLDNEGFTEGINYDKEFVLRDSKGNVLHNEDTGKQMRPDYIIHFPDKNDVVIDSKVSLVAYSDYIQAGTDEERKDASLRNLNSIREQVRNLARKDYSNYLAKDHRMLDYTIMFIPNYSAMQLAYSEDPKIWRDAFSKNVLITTEETLMPFLRMITIAWRNTEQVRNQEKIIDGASRMVRRVALLVDSFEKLGKKLDDARAAYANCDSKLRDSGQSIVRSAKDVVALGVPDSPGKGVGSIEMTEE